KESSGFWSDLPLAGIRQRSPSIDVAPDFVDDRCGVVLLVGGGQPLALVEDETLLLGRFVLLRFWNWRDELRAAPCINNFLGRLPMLIQLPVPGRIDVGRVQYRMIEEGIRHSRSAPGPTAIYARVCFGVKNWIELSNISRTRSEFPQHPADRGCRKGLSTAA